VGGGRKGGKVLIRSEKRGGNGNGVPEVPRNPRRKGMRDLKGRGDRGGKGAEGYRGGSFCRTRSEGCGSKKKKKQVSLEGEEVSRGGRGKKDGTDRRLEISLSLRVIFERRPGGQKKKAEATKLGIRVGE